ncbi:hypothetical protein ILUMI_24428 [Ignelater luminosus]|uniref:Uncharacterized protein n=1 Tax=Ignelater luminosus TaxID=2038154 RepID=A0A8K0G0N1_IGNLU|nr:hypothetical protein ILUMI_24428 [Ignelater luminosus]
MDIPEIDNAANQVVVNLLPTKSKQTYDLPCNCFKEWSDTKHVENVTENVLVVYFDEQSVTLKSSISWLTFSQFKATLNVNDTIDISKFTKLVAFLKRKSDNYKPKKYKIFSKKETETVLREAPDDRFLMTKVALIIGDTR